MVRIKDERRIADKKGESVTIPLVIERITVFYDPHISHPSGLSNEQAIAACWSSTDTVD